LDVRNLGLLPYLGALRVQDESVRRVVAGELDGVVLATRHPPVLTLGRRTAPSEVRVERWARRAAGVDLFFVDRGGGATFHDPGQAVVYPILRLDRLRCDVAGLVETLARAAVDWLEGLGIASDWDPERPGVYVNGAKIASIGLHVGGGVTHHGMAVNLRAGCRDGFSLVDPCKMPGLAVTSVEDLAGVRVDPDRAASEIAAAFLDRLARATPSSTPLARAGSLR
jgi:lipoate-protein ligase B